MVYWRARGSPMTKRIPLTRGKYAIVDDKDYEWLGQWRWYCDQDERMGYAVRGATVNGKRTTLQMHRVILNLKKGEITDHINGNGLDNRRCNLRKCTPSQNMWNRRKPKNNTSGYIGVDWHKRDKKWQARICRDRKQKHLGCFDDIEEAARAYDRAALELHGEFALLNFPDEPNVQNLQISLQGK